MDETQRKTDGPPLAVPSKEELVAMFEQADEKRWMELEWLLDRRDNTEEAQS